MRLLAWALRDLLKSRKFALIFVLNAALSLVGVLTIQTVDSALSANIAEKALSLLGADLTLSARRELTAQELNQLRAGLPTDRRENRAWEFFSMAQSAELAKLVSIKAIDPGFPLYGVLTLAESGAAQAELLAPVNGLPGLWVAPEFLSQFDIKVGESVTIGGLSFQVRDVVKSDSSQGLRFSAMAERVFALRSVIEASPLFTRGTTFTETVGFAWKGEPSPDFIADSFFKVNQDPTLRLRTVSDAQREFARPLQYLADYLGLVAVAALSLGFIGLSYLVRGFLLDRANTVAVWKILGMSWLRISSVIVFQFLILGLAAWVLAVMGSLLLLPILQTTLNAASEQALELGLRWDVSLRALGLVLFVLLAVAFPPIWVLSRRAVSAILRGEELFKGWQSKILEVGPTGIVLTLVALGFSNSYRIGFGFMSALLGVLVIFSLVTWVFLKLLSSREAIDWRIKQAQFFLTRNRSIVTIHIIALGLGAVLIGVFPHLREGLEQRFSRPDSKDVPSYFMFDIQDEQLPRVEAQIKDFGTSFLQKSPLVRARILTLNGAVYERPILETDQLTREEEEEARFRNRGVNLSYRPDLAPGDIIVDGSPLAPTYSGSGPVELSVEERYADRMNVKLGDKLVFDVQGVEVEGVVKNLRTVNWSRFQPNFFIILQPGLLDEAPKTWLAAVPPLEDSLKREFIRGMAKNFPNVSVVDVKDTADRTMQTADQMLLSVNLMFVLIFAVGSLVLGTVLFSQAKRRIWDLNLMRILGASEDSLRKVFRVEFFIVAAFASAVSLLFSLAIAWFVGWIFFEGMYAVSWSGMLIVAGSVFAISFVIGEAAHRRVLSSRPGILLRRGLD